jgi:hypothetical protein
MSDAPWLPNASADQCIASVLDLALAAPLALGSCVAVSAIEWSDEVRSACVECAHRPRLLLNRPFVARHCTTRERLAMLVLHELSHISLGHTRLYPRPTPAHNIAFDAVINARLLQGFRRRGIDPGPYAALLESLYDPGEEPLFLLRPPPGWPDEPRYAAGAPARLGSIHQRLYEDADRVTYAEIVRALHDRARAAGGGTDGGDLLDRLLGGHGRTEREAAALSGGRDHNAAAALGPTIAALGDAGHGQGWESRQEESLLTLDRHRADRRLEQALAKLLRRVFTQGAAPVRRFHSIPRPSVAVDPSRDRRAGGRALLARRFGAPPPLLFASWVEERRPERTAALVYLDVSGSMEELLPRLHGALGSLQRLLAAEVFVFSGGVVRAPLGEFLRGAVRTTWGTDIAPVLEHAAAHAGARRGSRRALVLTDGWFSPPPAALVTRLRQSGAALHLAVAGTGPLPRGDWVAGADRLPAFDLKH